MTLHAPPSSSESAPPRAEPPAARDAAPTALALKPAPAPASEPVAPAAADAEAAPPAPKPKKKRQAPQRRWEIPAWAVSLLVHLVVLGSLAAASFSSEVRQRLSELNAAFDTTIDDEIVPILDVLFDLPREDAVRLMNDGDSNTPQLANVTDGEPPGPLDSIVALRDLTFDKFPNDLIEDLLIEGGSGSVVGDVTREATDYGVALDQLAREILRHLSKHKLLVVWLFDESESMKDDQEAIRDRFDIVADQLKAHIEPDQKAEGALLHAIVGFGRDVHFDSPPTDDIDAIGRAIDRLRVDPSGIENTMQAIWKVIASFDRYITSERRMLLVVITDESGDDGANVEETRTLAVRKGVPIYVLGRQSMFGYGKAHLLYVDPVTKDHYWPAIDRGPETADVELLQWDGLHNRRDEQPAGFAPYELARLVKETGGIYFLLPNEEHLRVRRREKAYSMATLKEYVPDYDSRMAYDARRVKSEFRRTLFEIIQATKDATFPHHLPTEPPKLIPEAQKAIVKATERLNLLIMIEERLRKLKPHRDREPEKRWQAHYDLILAQVVAYQVKAYEYRALLAEMIQNPPMPETKPIPNKLSVTWVIGHSSQRKAPESETAQKYAEAERLLRQVIERHPETPWADLAQYELNRGLGVHRTEWSHSPSYDERAKLVPKF